MRQAVMIVLSLVVCACAVPPPRPVQRQFQWEPEEHTAYLGPGPAAIRGQGFLRQQGGGTVSCAGSDVWLLPGTPYFDESLRILATRDVDSIEGALWAVFGRYMRKSQCDGQGNFTFRDLPSLPWIVTTDVRWVVGYRSQGGRLVKLVTAVPGDTPPSLLSDRDLWSR